MHSSISNSNARLPEGTLLRQFMLALAVAVCVVLGWELFLRAMGFKPSFQDDAELWAKFRARAAEHGPHSIVFAGASRAQGGLRPDVFAETTGLPRPVQLAVGGCKVAPLLEDLANDPAFNGVVICDLMPAIEFSYQSGGSSLVDYIAYYHKREVSPSAKTDSILGAQVQHLFAYRLPELAPKRVLDTLRERQWSTQNYRLLQPDRTRFYDMSLLTDLDRRIEEVEEYLHSRDPLKPYAFGQYVDGMEKSVRRIRERGGEVAFIRMPSSGTVRTLEDEKFPRAQYWDDVAKRTSALCIHFEDYPELVGFTCPEGSHLAYEDAPEFTRALAGVLMNKLSLAERPKSAS